MNICKKCIYYAVMLSWCVTASVNAEEIGNCSVSGTATIDSAGEHFKVYDESGSYVGYVSLLADPSGSWSAWRDGEGATNELFATKDEVVFALCSPTL